jgi:hypothetical protein
MRAGQQGRKLEVQHYWGESNRIIASPSNTFASPTATWQAHETLSRLVSPWSGQSSSRVVNASLLVEQGPRGEGVDLGAVLLPSRHASLGTRRCVIGSAVVSSKSDRHA